jgi:integrase
MVQAERVWRDLADTAMAQGALPEVVRLACAVSLTRATGARQGELAGLLRTAVNVRRGTLRLVRLPQGRSANPPRLELHHLDDPALLLVRRWLPVRQDLITANLDGGTVTSLFVTVRATHTKTGTYPAGMPIHMDGLVQAWQRHANRQNGLNAGAHGWVPLPTRYEQLRRIWHPSASYGTTVNR